jgi:hypothetical protein
MTPPSSSERGAAKNNKRSNNLPRTDEESSDYRVNGKTRWCFLWHDEGSAFGSFRVGEWLGLEFVLNMLPQNQNNLLARHFLKREGGRIRGAVSRLTGGLSDSFRLQCGVLSSRTTGTLFTSQLPEQRGNQARAVGDLKYVKERVAEYVGPRLSVISFGETPMLPSALLVE